MDQGGSQRNTPLIGTSFAKIYRLTKRLGSGAFGEIFQCLNKQTQEELAIKLEKADSQHPQVFFEAKLYQYLNGSGTSSNDFTGIPRIHYCGTDNGYNLLVMEQLGQSLEDIFQAQKRRFSLKTVCMVADQMVSRMEFLHNKSFIHRDIKPDNFLMGLQKRAHKVYLIDFGLSKRFISKDGKHIPYRDGKSLTGTARYASINTHLGVEQSRRDDLESVGYVLMYFLRGQLPWQNLKATNKKDKYRAIMEKKMQTPTELLTKGFPKQFASYINYCKNLRFEDKPDYAYLRQLFREVLQANGFEYDNLYDWSSGTAIQAHGDKQSDSPAKRATAHAIVPPPLQQPGPQALQIQPNTLNSSKLHAQNPGSTVLNSRDQEERTQQTRPLFDTLRLTRNLNSSAAVTGVGGGGGGGGGAASSNNNYGLANMRTTLQSSNKFSSNRKSIDVKEEELLRLHTKFGNAAREDDKKSYHYSPDARQLSTQQQQQQQQLTHSGGAAVIQAQPNNRIYTIATQHKSSSLMQPGSAAAAITNQSQNLDMHVSAVVNSQPGAPQATVTKISSSYNNNRNPTLSRLQKQNQKLSELLKLQQQTNTAVAAATGTPSTAKPAAGVPLPRIVAHRTHNLYKH